MGSVRRLPQIGGAPRKTSNAALLHKKKPSDHNPLAGLFSKPSPPSREPAQSATEEPSTNPDASSHNVTGQKAPHVAQVLNRAKEEDPQGESWDDDFASDITFANLPRKDDKAAQSGKGLMPGGKKEDVSSEEDNQHTLRPGRSPTPGLAVSGKDKNASGSRAVSTSVVEDYSDIAFDEDEGGLAAKLANLKVSSRAEPSDAGTDGCSFAIKHNEVFSIQMISGNYQDRLPRRLKEPHQHPLTHPHPRTSRLQLLLYSHHPAHCPSPAPVQSFVHPQTRGKTRIDNARNQPSRILSWKSTLRTMTRITLIYSTRIPLLVGVSRGSGPEIQ